MRAVLLAAGEGTRLRPHTLDRPKCLVELGGKPLLTWQVGALRRAGVTDVTVVTGYKAERIEALGLATRHNARYATTNMVTSLMSARDLLDGRDDVIVGYGDLVYESRVIAAAAAFDAPLAVTVDREWKRLWQLRMADPLDDAETLRIDGDGNLVELGRRPSSLEEIEAQYMGIIAIRADAAKEIVSFYDALPEEGPYDGRDRDNMYMTSFLQQLIDHRVPVHAVVVDGGWLEIDTAAELDGYESLRQRGELAAYCELGA